MKKLLLTAFAVASLAMAFTSCKKDVSEEELLKNQLAQADSLLKRGGVIKYTVKVVSTANSSMLKAKMSIENASVTVYQNDKVFTGQTDAMGFVTFPDMRVGTVAVNVTLKDHAEVDYIADITPQEQLTNLSQSQVVNTIRYASTMVPMFPIADPGCATITGKVTAELDLTNTTPEPAPGVKVTATVDVDDPDFVSRYIAPTLSSGTPSAGRILKYAFSDATITATTDAQGVYTMKVPASLNGLPIRLNIDDFLSTQKLYMENDPSNGSFKPGEYIVPVLFSKNLESSQIPIVKSAYTTISEPDCPFGIVYKPAIFTFEIDANGTITKVNIIDKGNYSSEPSIIAYLQGENAILKATYNPITKGIDDVVITNGGNGYTINGSYVRAFIAQTTRNAKADLVIDNNGTVSSINITDKGMGYISNATIDIKTLNKDAILPSFKTTITPWSQEIGSIKILTPGRNFKTTGNIPEIKENITPTNLNIKYLFTGQNIIKNINLGTGVK